MARRTEQADLFNVPVLLAREMSFQQVQHFLAQLPNPPGQMREADMPRRFSLEQLRRLMRGE